MTKGVEWIPSTAALTRWVAELGDGDMALDCEADSMHHYPEKLCLVQLSHDGRDRVVDPLADVDLEPLRAPLADPERVKVLHGGDYDLRLLRREFDLEIRGLFDTMVAARLVGERNFGLAALLEANFGVRLDKRFQRADWSRRPISDEMLEYAAADTRHLLELAAILRARLVELGRVDWAAEEFARLESVRWGDRDPATAYRGVKGAGGLRPRDLAVLQELHAYRESCARQQDRPPGMLLRDDVLVELARSRPEDRVALGNIAGLSRRWTERSDAVRGLLEAVGRGMAQAEESLPARIERKMKRRDAPFRKGMQELRARRDVVAEELGIEPSVLANRASLEAAFELAEQGKDPTAAEGLRSWQVQVLRVVLESLGA